MKRYLFFVVLLGMAMVLIVGCSNETDTNESQANITKMSADEIIQLYVNAGFPINNIQVYTKDNDPDNLLGKSKEYTSKVVFNDTRIEQSSSSDTNSLTGGSIEVFKNETYAQSRETYLAAFNDTGASAQYMYSYKNILLRISGALTSDQAKQYETAFLTIQKGEVPAQFTK